MINHDGTIDYRGYTLTVSTIQVHIWRGPDFIDTVGGEPGSALAQAKKIIDEWMEAR